jgi:hypothetical protein
MNRKAATVLVNPSPGLWRMIDATRSAVRSVHSRLLAFIDSPVNVDPGFAGHFQRIIEAFFRDGTDSLGEWLDEEALHKLVRFCIRHVDVLAYQQLLSDLLAKFPGVLGDWRFQLIWDILKAAVVNAFDAQMVFSLLDPDDQRESRREHLVRERTSCETAFLRIHERSPLNWRR